MNRYVKIAFWYWVSICVLAGAVDGYWMGKCPNDPRMTARDVVETAITFPALIGFAMTAPSPPYPCKVKAP